MTQEIATAPSKLSIAPEPESKDVASVRGLLRTDTAIACNGGQIWAIEKDL